MKIIRIIRLLGVFLIFSTPFNAQCDVELTNVNWETGDVQMVVHNSDNCGIWWGVPWIDHINLGVSNGIDTLCIPCQNFPLHSFLNFDEQHFGDGIGDYGFAGDTLNFNLADASNANLSDTSNPLTVYERWMEWYSDSTFCEGAEIFVWQINHSNAPQVLNPDWYNPFGTAPDYPDVNPWDNILPIDGLCPCDTVYIDVEVIEYLTDTIIEYIDVVDTLYITETIIEYDTVMETEYVDVIIDNYIYVTDTITEFESIITYIDCETGEECGGISPCDETSIFAPNTVTPNGDGWNDTWQVIADGACWDQWEARIYNRWGGLVWISASNLDQWDGNVATGVYVYTITAHSSVNNNVFEFNGTITVFY